MLFGTLIKKTFQTLNFSQIDILNQDYRRTNVDEINTPNVWNSISWILKLNFVCEYRSNGNLPLELLELKHHKHLSIQMMV